LKTTIYSKPEEEEEEGEEAQRSSAFSSISVSIRMSRTSSK
jgi:hypothetical protein